VLRTITYADEEQSDSGEVGLHGESERKFEIVSWMMLSDEVSWMLRWGKRRTRLILLSLVVPVVVVEETIYLFRTM
jgi:hypothetical protein